MYRFHRRQLAVLALLVPTMSAMAQGPSAELEVSPETAIHSPYALDADRQIVQDNSGRCVRTGTWSAADAAATLLTNGKPAGCACDDAALPKSVCAPPVPVAMAPAPAEAAPPPVVEEVAPPAAGAQPPLQNVSLPADALFDFDQDTLNDQGRAALDGLIAKLSHVQVSQVTAVGHADRIGSQDYNMALSERRAAAVQAYLVQHAAISADLVKTEARGASEPVTAGRCDDLGPSRSSNVRLVECLAPDRRVDVAVYGAQQSMASIPPSAIVR